MANLISPSVSVSITDESFFIPAGEGTVPLLFIATADEKLQSDGVTPAAGTYEYDVVRTVTSRKQLLELYGIPNFLADATGNQYHGDARNEYGLWAAYNYLGIGSRIFVIRSNVNLNDDIVDVRALWNNKIQEATLELENLVQSYISEYNTINGYIPGDASSGYQEALYSIGLVATNTLTLANNTYDFSVNEDGAGNVSYNVVVDAFVNTYQELLDAINIQLPNSNISINTLGNLVIASNASGSSSSIILTQGTVLDLFSAITGFISFDTSITGQELYKESVSSSELISLTNEVTVSIFNSFSFKTLENYFIDDHRLAPLKIFAFGYDQPTSGDYWGYTGYVNDWADNSMGSIVNKEDEFTASEAGNTFIAAADDFQYTKEFKNGISLGANDAARRVTISTALQASINSNDEIRSENFEYTLIACPGYHETADEMVALSADILEEAFVVADTPLDKTSTEVVAWSNTNERQSSTNVAYYYPHGLASNVDGVNIYVPASSIALRTIAYNDNVAELWFAPAGTRRGVVTGITDVGYVSGQLGSPTTFNPLHLNLGQRDNLYKYFTNINPIVFFPGRGIIVFGQKSSAPNASALDRINVVRLIMYVKRQLRKNSLSYVFQPNDQLTRDNLKAMADGFLGDLIVRRGLYDSITICDSSNNTADRIDRNEMYLDVALKPVKSAEFIYIPIRVLNTGDDI